MNRIFYLGLCFFFVASPALAAPAPKEEPEPEPTKKERIQSQNNLKQLGLALHNFESTNGHLPANIRDKDGKDLLSWRVHLLPYIEEELLYRQFKLDEAWDSDNNKKLIEKIPKVMAPVRGKADKFTTFYQSFSGPEAFLHPKEKRGFVNITDGTSNTIAIAEAAKPVIWSKPDDMPFDSKKDPPSLGGLFKGETYVVMGDGSVRLLKKDIDPKILKALITISGGEVIEIPNPK